MFDGPLWEDAGGRAELRSLSRAEIQNYQGETLDELQGNLQEIIGKVA